MLVRRFGKYDFVLENKSNCRKLPGVVVDLPGVAGGGAVLVLYSGQLARVVGVAVGAATEATSWHCVQGLG